MSEIQAQLGSLEDTAKIAGQVQSRMKQIDQALTTARRTGGMEVEYRSAGAYICDQWSAHLGDRTAQERLEVYSRAAAHQKTSDNAGVIPIPQIGEVINFIDAARPMVNANP